MNEPLMLMTSVPNGKAWPQGCVLNHLPSQYRANVPTAPPTISHSILCLATRHNQVFTRPSFSPKPSPSAYLTILTVEGQSPEADGLGRANWTHEELADHLRKTHGVQTSRSAVQRFCAKIGIRLYRPTYRYERGDPAKQARAKEDLAELGKGQRPASSSC